MTDRVLDWIAFGPDATFSGIANWLTENIPVIDNVFANMLEITHIHLNETMSQQDIRGDEMIDPVMHIGFRTAKGDFKPYQSDVQERLERFTWALGANGEKLKRHCVVRDEIYYQEALELTLWQGGVVLGLLRYPGMGPFPEAPDYEIAAQYFVWQRQSDRYVGERLEIRLWGSYIPDFLAEGGEHLREIQEFPSALLTSPEITPGRQTGYVPLYQMKRPPARVELGRNYISAIYLGENDAARAALARLIEEA